MADIRFYPVCSGCGSILKDIIVDYDPHIPSIKYSNESPTFDIKMPEIIPSNCPFCGAKFDNILMQVALPYKGYEDIKII